jgi:large subunit ribosomal protein L9
MEVILIERSRLGNIGDVITVKPGFARNYLIPQKKALRANEQSKKQFEVRKAEIEQGINLKTQEAKDLLTKINGITVNLIRQAGEDGRLYGSVNSNDLVKLINEHAGISLHRSTIELITPIKYIGTYDVKVHIFSDIVADVKISVVRTAE